MGAARCPRQRTRSTSGCGTRDGAAFRLSWRRRGEAVTLTAGTRVGPCGALALRYEDASAG